MSENVYLSRWRNAMKKRSRLSEEVIDELEAHLIDSADELKRSGLQEDEAWLIAMRRLGSQSELSTDLSKVHRSRLYRELFNPEEKADIKSDRISILTVVILALGAALASHQPPFPFTGQRTVAELNTLSPLYRRVFPLFGPLSHGLYRSTGIVYQVLSKEGAVRRSDPLSGTLHGGLYYLVCHSLVPYACVLRIQINR